MDENHWSSFQYVDNLPMEEIKEDLKEQLCNSATSTWKHPSPIQPNTFSLLHLFLQWI